SAPRGLRSFPTRRSSDLVAAPVALPAVTLTVASHVPAESSATGTSNPLQVVALAVGKVSAVLVTVSLPIFSVSVHVPLTTCWIRSEEHTSELQSRENLVC